MAWSTIKHGKHKGESLPQVVFTDPDWFFDGMERHGFMGNQTLADEAQYVYEKARSIKIPQGDEFVAEYTVDPNTGKFNRVTIVPRSDDYTDNAIRRNFIDMGIPHWISRYDKRGSNWMVGDIKRIVFGDSKVRLTKNRCEAFFENDRYFV